MDYGKAIKIIRNSRGLSQKDLADRIRLAPSYISRIEAGERKPTIETLEKIAKKLGVPVYLIVLMSSNKTDLKGLPSDLINKLGENLLILTGNSCLMASGASVCPLYPLVSIRKLEHLLGFDRTYLDRLSSQAGRYYSSFDMRPKNSGKKWRHIDNPTGELREVQRRIYKNILKKFIFPESMIGGIPGGSIFKNAAYHVGQKQVLALDLRNCFPSTNNIMVYKAFIDKLGCSPDIASLVTKFTTYHRRIPQGAPTSPSIANLVLLDLHSRVNDIAKKACLNLTFYIDDIIISGPNVEECMEPVILAIQEHGYAVSNKKKKLMPASVPQKVTGLIVNRKVNIPTDYIEDLRKEIIKTSESGGISENELKTVRGKISHIRQVNPCIAEKMDEWVDDLDLAIYGRKNEDKNEYRNCRCAKRHRIDKIQKCTNPKTVS
jgi:transcriptional regulator with XRE-family HTH domain/retron-type reverse transcriptase